MRMDSTPAVVWFSNVDSCDAVGHSPEAPKVLQA